MKRTKWPGNWKVTCQSCGFWFPSSEIRKRWDGLLVCEKDWESRHPQTLIKIREETSVPAFVSKDTDPDQIVQVCTLPDSSCYIGMARVGCARVGNQQFTFAFLHDLSTNGHNIV
jgi:hypothetical protein